ncbi:MAG: hypothetical protein COB54_02685 [Alphaproteobacteria bacterium]|nr:MAG: hypothetical protein COB54_02685 [Alphaproteobacteria bacterium]
MKFLISLIVILSSYTVSLAADSKVMVTDAWARPVILMNRPGAAYFVIHNHSDVADKLIAASTPLAERIELHVHKHLDGVMKMERVQDIPVAAQGMTTVKPGGYHLMMFGLTKKLAVGDELPLTLTFAHAGEITVTAKVQKKAPPMDYSKMDHGKMKMDHSKMKMDHSKMKHDMN